MQKYKWDLDEIRNNIILLKDVYKTTNDEYAQEVINEIICVYIKMIELYSKKSSKSFDELLEGENVLEEILNDTAGFYLKKNIPILEAVINAYFVVKDSNIKDEIINPFICCNNEEIITITNDFFKKMTTPSLYNNYKEIMNKNNFLNIKYIKEDNYYAGVTLFDSILNKKYISVNRSNRLLDLIILPHELFHYIFNPDNDETINNFNCYYLTEVEGCFANVLFSEYYKKEALEFNNFFYDYYNTVFKIEINQLVIKDTLLDSTKNNTKIRLKKLNKHLNYFEIQEFNKEKDLTNYLNIPQDIIIKYALSQLIAIDLFYIYKKDKEEAFYLLKNLKYYKHEDDILSLLRRNHITFMDDEYENLKKYLKK